MKSVYQMLQEINKVMAANVRELHDAAKTLPVDQQAEYHLLVKQLCSTGMAVCDFKDKLEVEATVPETATNVVVGQYLAHQN